MWPPTAGERPLTQPCSPGSRPVCRGEAACTGQRGEAAARRRRDRVPVLAGPWGPFPKGVSGWLTDEFDSLSWVSEMGQWPGHSYCAEDWGPLRPQDLQAEGPLSLLG